LIHAVKKHTPLYRKTEIGLRHSVRKLFTAILHSSPDPISISTLKEGCVIDVSDSFTSFIGYSREEIIGRTALEIGFWLKPEDRSGMLSALNQRGFVRDLEIQFRTKSGEIRVGLLSAERIEISGTECLVVIIKDITDRKRAEEALRKSEERYKSLVDNLKLAVFRTTTNLKGRFLEVNPAMESISGYSKDQLLDIGVSKIYARSRELERFCQDVESSTEVVTREMALKKKDGTEIVTLVRAIAARDENGTAIYIDGIAEDITERKKMENALLLSEERFSKAFHCSPDPISIATLSDGLYIDVNESFTGLIGYSREEVIGRTAIEIDFWLKPEYRSEMISVLNQHGFVRDLEIQFRTKSGEIRLGLLSAERIEISGTECLVVITKDITDRKRIEEEQKRLKENMQFYITEITRAQEEERKRISRELHDETAQALASLYIDMEELSTMKNQLSELAIGKLKGLGERVQSMLEGIRRFSHELRPVLLDQFGLIPAIELMVEDITKEGWPCCRVESTGFQGRLAAELELILFRIVQEALNNVRKHSNATEAKVTLNHLQDKVQICVIDNGCGFAISEKRGSFADKAKFGILGMIERARLVNGRLFIHSELGKGTTVEVEVPT